MRVHLCGPAWLLRARSAAEVMPSSPPGPGDMDDRGEVEAVAELTASS